MTKINKNLVISGIVVLALGFGVLCGCGTSATQFNSYAFVARINQVDPTPFFYTAYQAFQVSGLTNLTAEEQAALNSAANNNNNLNNQASQNLNGLTYKRAASKGF